MGYVVLNVDEAPIVGPKVAPVVVELIRGLPGGSDLKLFGQGQARCLQGHLEAAAVALEQDHPRATRTAASL